MTCAVKILSFMARYLLKRRTSQNDLKRSKNDLKPSKTTKNNQCKNLCDLSKVFVLGFPMQVGTCFRVRDADLKTKTRPVTRTLKPDVVIQSRP